MSIVSSPILYPISGPREIILPETDGTRTFAKATDVFTGRLDPDFKDWGTDVPGGPTGKMPVTVYEMRQDATFTEMLSSLSENIDKVVLPQDKIIYFVENCRRWLRDEGYQTFFAFRVEEVGRREFFVTHVTLGHMGRLEADLTKLDHGRVWRSDNRRRVVIPQLEV